MADYERHLEDLNDLGVDVVALSVDSREDARAMQKAEELSFPVVYGLDVVEEADRIGAYYDADGGFFHATNLLLRNGRVFQATYSSGPIGRMRAAHVKGLVDFLQSDGDD